MLNGLTVNYTSTDKMITTEAIIPANKSLLQNNKQMAK